MGYVARMLGNSVAMLDRHYINPRTKDEAKAFWEIKPPSNRGAKRPVNGAKMIANGSAGPKAGNLAGAGLAPQGVVRELENAA